MALTTCDGVEPAAIETWVSEAMAGFPTKPEAPPDEKVSVVAAAVKVLASSLLALRCGAASALTLIEYVPADAVPVPLDPPETIAEFVDETVS